MAGIGYSMSKRASERKRQPRTESATATRKPVVDRERLREELHDFRAEVERQFSVFDHVPADAMSFVLR